MGVIITKQAEIDSYFESQALGQSTLKKLLGGIDNFLANQNKGKELYYEEKSYFIVGSAVDCILTGEEGEFDKQYYVSTLEKKPSDAEMSIVNRVFDELADNNIEIDLPLGDYMDMLMMAIVEAQWYKGNPGEKRIAGLLDRCSEYFEDLKRALGKQVMTSEQKTTIDNIVMSLKTNQRTSKYFDRENQERLDVDFYYQLPIYFTHRGVDCKALMDLVVVIKDNGNVVTVEPYDLKTMSGNTLGFLTSVKSHRYDIQASWYTLALGYWLINVLQVSNIEAVNIKNFTFIVESSTFPGTPLVYKLNNEFLDIGKSGRAAVKLVDTNLFSDNREADVTVAREIKGYEQLMDEFLFYEQNEWSEARVISEAKNGIIQLSWDGIINN